MRERDWQCKKEGGGREETECEREGERDCYCRLTLGKTAARHAVPSVPPSLPSLPLLLCPRGSTSKKQTTYMYVCVCERERANSGKKNKTFAPQPFYFCISGGCFNRYPELPRELPQAEAVPPTFKCCHITILCSSTPI